MKMYLNIPKALLVVGFAMALPMVAHANHDHDNIYKAAVHDESRSESDRARDAGRHPDKVLEFYGVEKGMHVVDLAAGGGYYTHIISNVVGPEGHVYAQTRPSSSTRQLDRINELSHTFENVDGLVESMNTMGLPDQSQDRVFMILMYHHFHADPAGGESLPAITPEVLAEIKRVLKPGGVFGIIEHEALEGSTRQQSNEWHRVPSALAIADLTAAGFEFAGASDVLTNANDPKNCHWNQCMERGASSRFVHAYRKPD